MRTYRKLTLLCAGLAWWIAAQASPVGDGLRASAGELTWARWQARVSIGAVAPAWRATLKESEPAGLRVNTLSVSSDFYLTEPIFERVNLGGLRATSGLIVGPRSQATVGQPALGARGSAFTAERRLLAAPPAPSDSAPDTASVPYFGLGYTGLSLRGRWSVSADVGVMALHPGNAARFGRVLGGTQSFDDVMRDLRWAPVLQMGVSYAF
jgi:hypothetical protein